MMDPQVMQFIDWLYQQTQWDGIHELREYIQTYWETESDVALVASLKYFDEKGDEVFGPMED